MGHLKTLTLKTIFNGTPVFLILMLAGRLNWAAALAVTIILTAVAYAADVYALPKTGNAMATVIDGALVFLLLWVVGLAGVRVAFTTVINVALVVIIIEGLVYHPYLKMLVTADYMGPRVE